MFISIKTCLCKQVFRNLKGTIKVLYIDNIKFDFDISKNLRSLSKLQYLY